MLGRGSVPRWNATLRRRYILWTSALDSKPNRPTVVGPRTAYTDCMTTAVPTRFSADQMQTLDRLVAEGVGGNRSEVIRKALDCLADSVERERVGRMIADSYRRQPQSATDDAMALANGIAMVEAEPW